MEERKRCEKNRRRRPKAFWDWNYICCSTYGNLRSKGYHQKYYKELLKSLDFPDIHFHQLRNIALMRREFHIYWDIPRKSFLQMFMEIQHRLQKNISMQPDEKQNSSERKSTNNNRTFVLFSYPPLYTFEIIFDIIGTVTRTNSKNKTGSEPSDIRYFRVLFNPEKSVL